MHLLSKRERESLNKDQFGCTSYIASLDAINNLDSLKGDQSMSLSSSHWIYIEASRFCHIITCISIKYCVMANV